jgi:hypothetical protein
MNLMLLKKKVMTIIEEIIFSDIIYNIYILNLLLNNYFGIIKRNQEQAKNISKKDF